MVSLYYMRRIILRHFKRIRHKEVDTVYDAFYLSLLESEKLESLKSEEPQSSEKLHPNQGD